MAGTRNRQKRGAHPRHEITILSGAQDSSRLGRGEVVEDLTLISSALLYADHVTLYSITVAILRQLRDMSNLPAEYSAKLLVDVMLSSEHPTYDEGQLLALSEQLGSLIELRERTSRRDRRAPGSKYDLLKKRLKPIAEQLRDQSFDLWKAHGGGQLEEAESAGQLTVMTSWVDDIFAGGELSQDAVIKLISDQVSGSDGSIMFDSMMGGVVSAAQKESVIALTTTSRYGLRRTATGAAMISYLPSFAGASISDILEAKRKIKTPLDAYKDAVKVLEGRIRADALDPGTFGEEIDFLWHDSVEPQLKELTSAFRDTRLPRVSGAVKGAAMGALPPGVIFLVGANVADSPALTPEDLDRMTKLVEGAGIDPLMSTDGLLGASVMGGVVGAVNGWRAAAKSISTIRNNGLFYLVDTNVSLARR